MAGGRAPLSPVWDAAPEKFRLHGVAVQRAADRIAREIAYHGTSLGALSATGITALRSPQIRMLVQKGDLQLSLFDEQDLAELRSDDFPGERLIACKNPLFAEERRR